MHLIFHMTNLLTISIFMVIWIEINTEERFGLHCSLTIEIVNHQSGFCRSMSGNQER